MRHPYSVTVELRCDQLGPDCPACTNAAIDLFGAILKFHGDKEARRIFTKLGKQPTTGQLKQIANLGLLDRLEVMRPRSIRRLARETAEKNQLLKPDERPPGPSGSTNRDSLERYIRKLVKLIFYLFYNI